MNILITGGAGYIGSVVAEECLSVGHSAVVYDNLVKGHREMVGPDAVFVEGELADAALLTDTLRQHKIDAVIHMAAYSLVGESVLEPAKYYQNNVVAGLVLLDSMRAAGVLKMVFSSTAAVYREPEKQPITEDDALQPTNPYGDTKLAFERALRTYDRAYGLRSASLRYFNAAGATQRCGEMHDPETHLIPLVLKAARGEIEAIDIFGDDYPTRDGTCVRDYIHVVDLARAHVLALDGLDAESSVYNLGCGGQGYTVHEVIAAAAAVTGRNIPVKVAPRRTGDPAVLIASSERARGELGWKPEFDNIDAIIGSAWNWLEKREKSSASGTIK